MSDKSLIIVDGADSAKVMREAEYRQKRRQLVDYVLEAHGAERWVRTRRLWFMIDPNAMRDHSDAVKEAMYIRRTSLDPETGKSRQSLGIAYGERGNKHTDRRLVAVLPEELRTLLMRFDPYNLALRRGKENSQLWNEVYRTFPEYSCVRNLNYRYGKDS